MKLPSSSAISSACWETYRSSQQADGILLPVEGLDHPQNQGLRREGWSKGLISMGKNLKNHHPTTEDQQINNPTSFKIIIIMVIIIILKSSPSNNSVSEWLWLPFKIISVHFWWLRIARKQSTTTLWRSRPWPRVVCLSLYTWWRTTHGELKWVSSPQWLTSDFCRVNPLKKLGWTNPQPRAVDSSPPSMHYVLVTVYIKYTSLNNIVARVHQTRWMLNSHMDIIYCIHIHLWSPICLSGCKKGLLKQEGPFGMPRIREIFSPQTFVRLQWEMCFKTTYFQHFSIDNTLNAGKSHKTIKKKPCLTRIPPLAIDFIYWTKKSTDIRDFEGGSQVGSSQVSRF